MTNANRVHRWLIITLCSRTSNSQLQFRQHICLAVQQTQQLSTVRRASAVSAVELLVGRAGVLVNPVLFQPESACNGFASTPEQALAPYLSAVEEFV